jgi:hypothetical protein
MGSREQGEGGKDREGGEDGERRRAKSEGERRIGGREQGARGRDLGKIERAKGRK